MTTILSFFIILLITFLLFVLLGKLFEAELEFLSLFDFLILVALGLLLILLEVGLSWIDLSLLATSVLIVYIFFALKSSDKKIFKKKDRNKIDKLVNKIYRNKETLFQKIKSDDHLDDYSYLKLEYEKGNVKNINFQERYKSFYKMHLFGFTQEFYQKYFEFLKNGNDNIEKILRELSQIENESGKKTVQLAFTSKLIHTVDSTKPLYNSTVSDIFDLTVKRGPIEERIQSSLEAYKELKNQYQKLIKRDKIKTVIEKFRERFNFKEGILTDYKLLDLIFKHVRDL